MRMIRLLFAVLFFSGAALAQSAPPSAAGPQPLSGHYLPQQIFTSAGSFQLLPNMAGVIVRGCGGGGGGGGGSLSATSVASSGGGGAGGAGCNGQGVFLSSAELLALYPTGAIPVTVAAAGTGGLGATTSSTSGVGGTAGGISTFGSVFRCTGGGGGAGGQTGAASSGGGGGGACGSTGSGGQWVWSDGRHERRYDSRRRRRHDGQHWWRRNRPSGRLWRKRRLVVRHGILRRYCCQRRIRGRLWRWIDRRGCS